MSFGFSIGDFIVLLQLANNVRRRFVDAPLQMKAVAESVKSLSSVLRDIDDMLPQRYLTSDQEDRLGEITQTCQGTLKQLEDRLAGYQTTKLDLWKRLKWDQKEIDVFQKRIVLNISSFNAFLALLASGVSLKINAEVERLHERQDRRDCSEEQKNILDWLSQTDYASQQSDFINRRQHGTGQWLLDSPEFSEWTKTNRQTLYCPGMPGAGKTMITSIVVQHLHMKHRDEHNVAVAYIYCNFKRQQEQNPEKFLESLLRQLIQGRADTPVLVSDLYNSHIRNGTRPSFDELSKVLRKVLTDFSRAFVVIDALDECQVVGGTRRRFLQVLFSIQEDTDLNLFVTSRFIPEIVEEFTRSTTLEIRANQEDVRRYLDGQVLQRQLSSCIKRRSDLQQEIKEAIVASVDGMFLLAQLHLNSLEGMTTVKAVRSALQKLPSGSEAYDKSYDEAMQRIQSQLLDSRTLAIQVLSWIVCAKRPLTTTELQHALAVEVGESALDEDNIPEIQDIVSVCAGLVTVDPESNIIRLVHYTTQEYFRRTWKSWFPEAQVDIGRTCISYLSFEAFDCEIKLWSRWHIRGKVLAEYPLYEYASRNWAHHVRGTAIESSALALALLNRRNNIDLSAQVAITGTFPWSHVLSVKSHDFRNAIVPTTGLHVADYFGLVDSINCLLQTGFSRDSLDGARLPSLTYAAFRGQHAAVKLMLDDSIPHPSALIYAAGSNHVDIVRTLLAAGADVNSHTGLRVSALKAAALRGHFEVMRILLEHGADANAIDGDRRLPLLVAAKDGNKEMVQILLAHGADCNAQGMGGSPLKAASWGGHDGVVELLIQHGAKVNSEADRESALVGASAMGHMKVVQLLLANGADCNAQGRHDSPLHVASKGGYDNVAQLLLKYGANVNSERDGETALFGASAKGYFKVVEILLDHGADCNAGTKSPLTSASTEGYHDIVQLLVKHGAREKVTTTSRVDSGWAGAN